MIADRISLICLFVDARLTICVGAALFLAALALSVVLFEVVVFPLVLLCCDWFRLSCFGRAKQERLAAMRLCGSLDRLCSGWACFWRWRSRLALGILSLVV